MRFLGSKLNLLEQIELLVDEKSDGTELTFLDMFAGTNTVGAYFRSRFNVISNDLLYFSYLGAIARICPTEELNFRELINLVGTDPISYLNSEANRHANTPTSFPGYYELAYSPTGDAMYISIKNAKRIDFIRETIAQWKNSGLLNEVEHAYLVTSLIEAISNVSNTTGTYGAFLKHWDKRALNQLTLQPLHINYTTHAGTAYNSDATQLAETISADIIYLDPPYNNRQYASNYHLLENVARHDKPALKGKTKIFDWSQLKSKFSQVKQVTSEFSLLLSKLRGTHLIVSYNNEGLIPIEELKALIEKVALPGTVEVRRFPFRKYKSKIPSTRDGLEEVLIYCRLKKQLQKKSGILQQKEQKNLQGIAFDITLTRTELIKSPVNYIGGKFKLLPQILPLFPDEIDTFVDLFSGGANVGINAKAQHHIFHDMNYRINEMFRFFQSEEPLNLVHDIRRIIDETGLSKTNEAAYLRFRSAYNENPSPLHLYILASFGYNYQFRFNNSMQFNNPFGRNRSHFSINMERNLIRFVSRLREMDALFVDGYFEEFDISSLSNKDFVYLDPPYLITTGSYNDGNRGFQNWGEQQEQKLLDLMARLSQQGVRYALSNVLWHKGQTNHILAEFIESNHVVVHQLTFDYYNSSHNTQRKGSQEVLITNY